MRKVLYKEVGLEASLELKAGDMEQISQAEARSEKYKVNGLRKKSK